jgi:hypothetical protein
MEPTEPTLQEEVAHDKVVMRTEYIIGGLVILVLILAGVIWYMATHPTSAPVPSETMATSTPSTPTAGNTGSLNESGAYYEITAKYPTATPIATAGSVEANAKAVDVMKQFEVNAIAEFKKQGNFANLSHDDVQMMGLDQRKESLRIAYEAHTGSGTVSYVFTIVEDTLGAHPNTTYQTFTFNTKTGTVLSLSDLFAPGASYLTTLSNKTRALLPAAIAKREGISAASVDKTMLNSGTTAKAENFQNWYTEGTNLVIIFPPYQVAAYAAGTQTVSIPFSQLTSLKANTKVNDFGVIQ